MNNSAKRQLVLVVDDNPKVLKFIEIDLKLHGFEVATTTSGKEALELVKSKKPDIMLLDIIMPVMDGLEVLRQLRALSQLPVIAFSASHGNRDDALRLGANAFISKPFQPDDMVRRIEALIGH
jgi:two-component system KDP operon response regulator KdpE